jgi:hypothetical protein
MDCQLSAFIYTKIKVMKRGAWASPTTVISSFVCWLCTMPVSRHSCEDPNLNLKLVFFLTEYWSYDASVQDIFFLLIENDDWSYGIHE